MSILLLSLFVLQSDPAMPPANPEHNAAVVASPAPGPSAPVIEQGKEVDWAVGVFRDAKAAAGEKRWGLLVSILLMAFLSLFSWAFLRVKELRDRLRDYMPETALAVSLVAYISIAVGALPPGAHIGDWWDVVLPALKTGLAAVGAWEFLAKRVLGYWGPKLFDWIKALLAKKATP